MRYPRDVLPPSGAVAQVGYDARLEIGDVHKRVLSASEHLLRQISSGETCVPIAAGTYATTPLIRGTLTGPAMRRAVVSGGLQVGVPARPNGRTLQPPPPIGVHWLDVRQYRDRSHARLASAD